MKLGIVRQYDEWIELKRGRFATTAIKVIGEVDEDSVDTVAVELSKKQAGIFFVAFPIEKTREQSLMFSYEKAEDGAPEYHVFSAGYQNGKKIFPKIGQEVVPSV